MSNELNLPDGQNMDLDDVNEAQVAATPRRGRPRSAVREGGTDQARSPVRSDGSVIGRDGEVLSRKSVDLLTGDIFNIPDYMIPKGWDYQWIAVSIYGNTEVVMDQNLTMAVQGWRPVSAKRHDGLLMPKGHVGNIIRGGQMLVERPTVLGDQARAEEVAKARRQMTDRDQALLGGKANARAVMRDGIEMGGRYRGTGGDIKITVDRALDIPAPQHTLADPGE